MRGRRLAAGLSLVACGVAGIVMHGQIQTALPPPVPVEPITAILDAFRTHDLVAFPDAHGNLQNHGLRLALIRDPRFATVVNDIVLEMGNARYQEDADRFVRGERVPLTRLRRIWEDTVVLTAGNNFSMTRDVLEAVRAINNRLPAERRLRVLLGDPPIDWSTVRTRGDHDRWLALRDSHPAALIQLEVLAKRRKALLAYGTMHYQRRQIMSNYDMSSWQMQTLVSLIEAATPARVFTIVEHDVARLGVSVDRWPIPGLALLRGTSIGALDFARFAPPMASRRFSVRGRTDLEFTPIPEDQFRVVPAEQQVDAVLYLGPPSAQTTRASHEVPVDRCRDAAWVDTMLKRIELAGLPSFEGERLKSYCAASAQ